MHRRCESAVCTTPKGTPVWHSCCTGTDAVLLLQNTWDEVPTELHLNRERRGVCRQHNTCSADSDTDQQLLRLPGVSPQPSRYRHTLLPAQVRPTSRLLPALVRAWAAPLCLMAQRVTGFLLISLGQGTPAQTRPSSTPASSRLGVEHCRNGSAARTPNAAIITHAAAVGGSNWSNMYTAPSRLFSCRTTWSVCTRF